jgi:uncharacterized protein (TIGR04255 family)
MDYKKLSNQPLKFVLAEFKFSPVLQMDRFIPEIQEAFRKKFPIVQSKTDRIVQVYNESIETKDVARWSFISPDKSQAIELDQERIIYFTSVYDRFEGFAISCEKILKVLSDIVEPTLIQRIGLRYSDLIVIEDGEKMTDLVNTHFTCPDVLCNLGTNKQQKTEILINTNVGKLAIRTLYGVHELSHSLDLLGRLPISIPLDNSFNERIILDFDHFWEALDTPLEFDNKYILQKLKELHQIAREAFWCLTTEYARDIKWS